MRAFAPGYSLISRVVGVFFIAGSSPDQGAQLLDQPEMRGALDYGSRLDELYETQPFQCIR